MTLQAIEEWAGRVEADGAWVRANWIRSQEQELQAEMERPPTTKGYAA